MLYISIFRAVKNLELFEKMEKDGTLVKDEILLNHYGVLLDLVVEKNAQFFDLVKGGLAMKNMLLEMDALSIPQADRAVYTGLIQKNSS